MIPPLVNTWLVLLLCLSRSHARPVTISRTYYNSPENVPPQNREIQETPDINQTSSFCYNHSLTCDKRPLTLKNMEEKSVKRLTKSFTCPSTVCPGKDFLVGLYPFSDIPSHSTAADVTRIYNNAIYNKACPGISESNINLFGICLHMCKTDFECTQLHAGWHCCPIRDLLQDQFLLNCVPPMRHKAKHVESELE